MGNAFARASGHFQVNRTRVGQGSEDRRIIRGMSEMRTVGGAGLEREVWLLRERERGLRYLTQSKCCTLRPQAELELERVRIEISSAFEQIRRLQLHF